MQQLPNPQCDYLFEHTTGDHSKQFRASLYMVMSDRRFLFRKGGGGTSRNGEWEAMKNRIFYFHFNHNF